ncbi:hypothetical protein HHE02_15000 [Helicobacter heilmannii]|nr:hypothetical protein HHE02_15000 [Helicobacter heilmannii]CRF48923.1 hypothetical protein HHE03_05120 [Helicobacter heilmannii]
MIFNHIKDLIKRPILIIKILSLVILLCLNLCISNCLFKTTPDKHQVPKNKAEGI